MKLKACNGLGPNRDDKVMHDQDQRPQKDEGTEDRNLCEKVAKMRSMEVSCEKNWKGPTSTEHFYSCLQNKICRKLDFVDM